MPRGRGLQAAAAAVVEHIADPSSMAMRDALVALEEAVVTERERGARRVARMRARRKEQPDA